MSNSILSYETEAEYRRYLESLDEKALTDEYYACNRLKEAVEARTEQLCKTVCNDICKWLMDIDHDDITSYEHYLYRVLLRFERFVNREVEELKNLRGFYDPTPIQSHPQSPNADSVFAVYAEALQEFRRMERIVSSFEEKLKMWMYFLYNMGDIQKEQKTEESRRRVCVVHEDGSYDFCYQLEVVYKELRSIIETETGRQIADFVD